jgi:transcriptional regulator with XRE-family HTH domain
MSTTRLEQEFYGALIKELARVRKMQGISQEELSARLGVSDTMVAKWEAGLRLPTSYWLMCWAQTLNLTIKVTHE